MEWSLDRISWRSARCLALVMLFMCLLSGVESLQCFNCRGMSYYDPDFCLNPTKSRTVTRECLKGEMCETRLQRRETDKIIERGCTNACAGRTNVWTDYFQVHCCDTNECNRGSLKQYSTVTLFICLLLWLSR